MADSIRQLAQSRQEQKKEDEWDYFGKSIASQIRAIPFAWQRSMALIKIQQALHEVVYNSLGSSPSNSSVNVSMKPNQLSHQFPPSAAATYQPHPSEFECNFLQPYNRSDTPATPINRPAQVLDANNRIV